MSKHLGLMVLSGTLLLQTSVSVEARVVYGVDNRVEVFEATPFQQKLAHSAATMIPANSIYKASMNHMEVSQDYTLGRLLRSMTPQGLKACSTERFTEQPTPGMCSGFLIAPDLIVTAGHCMDDASSCTDNRWVFDFKVDPDSKTAGAKIRNEDVYKCKRVVSQTLNEPLKLDYAIVQLDRAVSDREPLTLNTDEEIRNYTPLVVIGSPSGLPLKVAAGARVRDNIHPNYFNSNLDSFQGNSGSAVFNARSGKVEGILVRGEQDYDVDIVKRCVKTYKCSELGCRGEDVSRITSIPEVGIQSVLAEAAFTGNLENLSKLLRLGTWIDFNLKDGQSALIKASQNGKTEAMKLLIKAGANVNLQDAEGNSGLHHLARTLNNDSREALNLLLENGANLELKNHKGETALEVAAGNSNAAGVEILKGIRGHAAM